MAPLINKIYGVKELELFTNVIRNSFRTVADQFGLTEINSPTNPAFTTAENLKNLALKAECFGLYKNGIPCGFFALEFNYESKSVFLERVCVLPEYRHNGFGKTILEFAESYCRERSADKISIGMMNNNTVLKNWYIENGFTEISVKQFSHLLFDVCFLENHLK